MLDYGYEQSCTKDYLFTDDETGETFFVETCDGLDCAEGIAMEYFKSPQFIDVYEPWMADILGYDTY